MSKKLADLQNKIYNSVSGMDFHLNSMKKSFFSSIESKLSLAKVVDKFECTFGAKVSLYPGLLWFSIFCPISDKCIL